MPYNSAADSFRTKQLCSRLSERYRAKNGKNGHFAFFDPLWGLRAGCDVHLRLIGKRVVFFLLVIIEFFSLAVTLVELRFRRGGSL